jgi:phytoene dehydrogenase-like protein
MGDRHDAVIIGGGHNGLVAATLLARAGRDVVVLERSAAVGGAAVSMSPFPGVDVRLSRFAYLVSLFPADLLSELGVDVEMRPRGPVAVPLPPLDGVADAVFPTLTQPLRSRAQMRALVGEPAWRALFEAPLSELLEAEIVDDEARGVALTDGLIGTFAPADDPLLRQNRCFLFHVIGNGTGRWDVPVGGMGAVTDALAAAARRAGAALRTRAEVVSVATDGREAEVTLADGELLAARHVLANCAPAVLARLLGAEPGMADTPEGSQLKINMLLTRLPRLRDPAMSPADAFRGTFHVNESYVQLDAAYREAAAGQVPALPPCEFYCHSLTDPSILSAELRAAGAHTLTLFALHMPARLFHGPGADHDAVKAAAVAATLRSVNSALAEPIEDCLQRDADDAPCLEAHTPIELEAELAMPGGHIFHRDLSWPFAEREDEVGRWGVETEEPNVWLCGAGARRGGGVSGIPGHNAAQAVLAADVMGRSQSPQPRLCHGAAELTRPSAPPGRRT